MKLVKGAKALKDLKAGDKVLMSEACTHHAQPDDIGRVKIPRWIRQHINNEIQFDFVSGRDYPDNLSDYKVVIHCGACTLNRKEMLSRIDASIVQGVPIINYGLCIAFLHGILDRALKPFPEVYFEWMDARIKKGEHMKKLFLVLMIMAITGCSNSRRLTKKYEKKPSIERAMLPGMERSFIKKLTASV